MAAESQRRLRACLREHLTRTRELHVPAAVTRVDFDDIVAAARHELRSEGVGGVNGAAGADIEVFCAEWRCSSGGEGSGGGGGGGGVDGRLCGACVRCVSERRLGELLLREYVARNVPVIVTNYIRRPWAAAVERWSDDAYLLSRIGADTPVRMQSVPTGHQADAIVTVQRSPMTAAAKASVGVGGGVSISGTVRNGIDDARVDAAPAGGSGDTEFAFVEPLERCVPFRVFLQLLDGDSGASDSTGSAGSAAASLHGPASGVHSLQYQNDSFRGEYAPALGGDVPGYADGFPFARVCFGDAHMEALNFWLGRERTVTSLHKDHYENLYAVIGGTKVFHLYPPSDAAFMPYVECASYRFAAAAAAAADNDNDMDTAKRRAGEAANGAIQVDDEYCIVPQLDDNGELVRVPWIRADPSVDGEQCARCLLAHSSPPSPSSAAVCFQCDVKPLEVHVGAGELLYLPALWYHRVSQRVADATSRRVIAMNFWYDMRFDSPLYTYHALMAQLRDCV